MSSESSVTTTQLDTGVCVVTSAIQSGPFDDEVLRRTPGLAAMGGGELCVDFGARVFFVRFSSIHFVVLSNRLTCAIILSSRGLFCCDSVVKLDFDSLRIRVMKAGRTSCSAYFVMLNDWCMCR